MATNLIDLLTESGFSTSPEVREWVKREADVLGMNDGGPYVAHEVYVKGDWSVTLEQTSAPSGDLVITYPKVLVIDSPNGRVAVNPNDLDLVAELIAGASE